MLSPRQTLILSFALVVVSLLSTTLSLFAYSYPTWTLVTGSTTRMEPVLTRPTAEPLNFRYTLPTPDLTERVPSSLPNAKEAAGTDRQTRSAVSQTRRLIDARSISAAGEPSMRGL